MRPNSVLFWAGLLVTAVTAAVAQVAGPVVRLPPFVVTDVPEGLPWRYARFGAMEILSLAPDHLARSVVQAEVRGRMFLPELFQPARSAPVQFVLFGADAGATSPDAVRVKEGQSAVFGATVVEHSGELVLSDRETLLFAANLAGVDDWATVSYHYAARGLREATPPYPAWLVEGLFGPFGCYTNGMAVLEYLRGMSGGMMFAPFSWKPEPGEPAAEQILPGWRQANLPPLASLFNSAPPDPVRERARYRLWSLHAGVFVRSKLFAPRVAWQEPEAFWKFAALATIQPVTERSFREAFGSGFAVAEEKLRRQFELMMSGIDAVDVLNLHYPPRGTEKLAFRAATETEIARLKGNWERLEAARLRPGWPALARDYEHAARKTLTRGLRRGGDDPAVRAVLGLLEFEAGAPAAARPHLEAAFAADRAGSRALAALARLRFDERAASGGKLGEAEMEAVLAPLFRAKERQPALPEVYQLIASAWETSEVTPTAEHLNVLVEGALHFPRDTDLVLRFARLHQRHGFRDRALGLAAFAETHASGAPARERCATFLAELQHAG